MSRDMNVRLNFSFWLLVLAVAVAVVVIIVVLCSLFGYKTLTYLCIQVTLTFYHILSKSFKCHNESSFAR